MAVVTAGTPEWHAAEVARRVEAEGVCIHWSELFGEVVAFVKADSYRRMVRRTVPVYTCAELAQLFPDGAAPLDPAFLQRVHQAKKLSGGTVIGNEPD